MFNIFITMEDYIKRIVKYVLDEKYPEFEGVEVTSARNPQSFYIDKTRNLEYDVFLIMINKLVRRYSVTDMNLFQSLFGVFITWLTANFHSFLS